MKPDFYDDRNMEPWKAKKSKATDRKEKKSKKHKDKDQFRQHVQDFIDRRDDKDYNYEGE